MPDDTNELLRQILETQRELLAAHEKEMERASEFRIAAIELQKAAQRKALIAAIVVAVGLGIMLLAAFGANLPRR